MSARAFAIVMVLAAAPAVVFVQPLPPSLFTFHSDEFWLNLHHFLYVLGRAQLRAADASRAAVVDAPRDADQGGAGLTEAEQRTWSASIDQYATGLSRKDVMFDDPLPAIAVAVAAAGDRPRLRGRVRCVVAAPLGRITARATSQAVARRDLETAPGWLNEP